MRRFVVAALVSAAAASVSAASAPAGEPAWPVRDPGAETVSPRPTVRVDPVDGQPASSDAEESAPDEADAGEAGKDSTSDGDASSDGNQAAQGTLADGGEEVRLRLGEARMPWIPGPVRTGFYFDDGLRYENDRLDLRMALLGRFHYDVLTGSQSREVERAVGSLPEDPFVRRLRLDLRGHWGANIDFIAQYDPENPDVTWRKVYVDYRGFPRVGLIRLGYFPEPIGLEHLMSSNHSTFLERGVPFAFSPRSNAGIAAHNALSNRRIFCQIGAFNEVASYDERPSGDWSGTARVAGLPWIDEDEKRFVHLGIAASVRAPKDGVSYSTRPEIGKGPQYVSTTAPDSERAVLWAGEAACVWGPLSMQAEWIRAAVDDANMRGDADYDAYYAYVSYVLTGESRTYDRQGGGTSRGSSQDARF